ncbi:TRAP transporter small permease [Microbacterium sp. A84]|uniref:TRAP transporter small permease n=1 Tax=Microbacterium sp. A84 TaxID=3450715 RepID=UPI003F4284E6
MTTNPPDDAGEANPPAGATRWHGLMAVLGTARKGVDRLLGWLCIIVFVALVVIVAWQVFTREVLGDTAAWTQEAAQYSFVILAMIAAAYVFSERGHIAVEILIEKLPLRSRRAAAVVIELIVVFFIVAVFIIGGLAVAQNAWHQSLSSLPLTIGQIYLIMPISGVLILFYSIVQIIGLLAGVEEPTPDTNDISEAI